MVRRVTEKESHWINKSFDLLTRIKSGGITEVVYKISVPIFTAIHLISVEIFQSGSNGMTKWHYPQTLEKNTRWQTFAMWADTTGFHTMPWNVTSSIDIITPGQQTADSQRFPYVVFPSKYNLSVNSGLLSQLTTAQLSAKLIHENISLLRERLSNTAVHPTHIISFLWCMWLHHSCIITHMAMYHGSMFKKKRFSLIYFPNIYFIKPAVSGDGISVRIGTSFRFSFSFRVNVQWVNDECFVSIRQQGS